MYFHFLILLPICLCDSVVFGVHVIGNSSMSLDANQIRIVAKKEIDRSNSFYCKTDVV